MFRACVFVLLTLAGIGAEAQSNQPQFYGWKQPATAQRILYPTPLRDLLFGKQRAVPTGPPVPYYLVPGQLVPPQIVYPRQVQPQIVRPEAKERNLSRRPGDEFL